MQKLILDSCCVKYVEYSMEGLIKNNRGLTASENCTVGDQDQWIQEEQGAGHKTITMAWLKLNWYPFSNIPSVI